MARLSICTLGSLDVTLDGEPVTGFESNKVRALLVYLAVEASRLHSRDTLAGLLWPDQPDRAARRNLSQALFNLRQVIRDDKADPPFLQITPGTIQFNPNSDHWLDVAVFTAHVTAAEAHAQTWDEPNIRQMEQAVELYRGEFLMGFFVDESVPFAEWATLRRERFHQQVLGALYRLSQHYEQHRDYERACHHARRQVELEPWREEAHQQLMRLLARCGQRSAALQQYETCRRTLAEELGIEPSEDTTRLYRRIKLVSKLGAHNLPPQITPFVGRKTELHELGERLVNPACRLLTLVGPGGIGKTRLAIQAAHENRFAFLHGVCFVSLASVLSTEFLVPTMAHALQIRLEGQTDPRQQLLDALRGREMLLVLDNLEHLIEDSADLLAEILQAAPDVKLLVTSRERLNLYGETVFDVGGLNIPEEAESKNAASYSAVELFLQSADRAQAGFAPNGELIDIVRICRLVDGMPLGIELAASWVRTLSCQEIAAAIEQDLTFLSTSVRGIPSRHRSMQAAFDHSWKRLAAEEQRIFRKLSVFRGGFSREAATHVTGASPLNLSTLLDKSFLNQTAAGRYSLHELMRQYAADKLAQDPQEARATRDEHGRYYTRFMNGEFERFQAGQQRQALDAMEAEMDNVRVAWQWAIDQGQHECLSRLMKGLYLFCFVRNVREGDVLFGKAVAALENIIAGQPVAKEEALCLLGQLLWRWGHFVRTTHPTDEKTEALLQRSVALLRSNTDREELAQALHGLGRFLEAGGRYAEARRIFKESIDIGRRLPDPRYLAQALTGLTTIARSADELLQAKQLVQEGLAIHRKLGDWRGIAYSLSALSGVAYYLGEQAEAKRLCLETKSILEDLGDAAMATVMLSNAGHVCLELGEYDMAAQYLKEALQRSVALHQGRFTMNILHGLADLAFREGHYLRAYELATFVSGTPMTYPSTLEDAQHLANELEARLLPEIAAAARARAMSWTLDDVVAEV